MPVVVSQQDLHGLLSSDEELGRALDAVQRSLLDRHGGAAGHVVFADLPLEGEQAFKVMGCSAAGAPATLRVFPGRDDIAAHEDTSFLLVLDPASGALRALLAGDSLNPLRTSVPAGVGARHLAPPGARTLGVLGSGAQARGHARVIVRAVPTVAEILVWSPTQANREAFAEEQTAALGIPVRACASAQEVVTRADVVTAAGRLPGGTPAYEDAWLKPGALAISVTRSAPPALVERARFVVPTQRRPERVALGFTGPAAPRPAPDPAHAVQLADVILGAAPARLDAAQPVVFELANVYLWDQAIASWAFDWAARNGVGDHIELSPETDRRYA